VFEYGRANAGNSLNHQQVDAFVLDLR